MQSLWGVNSEMYSLPSLRSFPGGSDIKESACNARDQGSVPGLGRSPGEGHEYSHQYSYLENSMDRIILILIFLLFQFIQNTMAPLYIHIFVVWFFCFCLMLLESLLGFEFKAFNWVGVCGGESCVMGQGYTHGILDS